MQGCTPPRCHASDIALDDIKLTSEYSGKSIKMEPLPPQAGDVGDVHLNHAHQAGSHSTSRAHFDASLILLLKDLQERISSEYSHHIAKQERALKTRIAVLTKENNGLREQLGVVDVAVEPDDCEREVRKESSVVDSDVAEEAAVHEHESRARGNMAHGRKSTCRENTFEPWSCWVNSKELKMARTLRLNEISVTHSHPLAAIQGQGTSASMCSANVGMDEAFPRSCVLSPASNLFLAWQFMFTVVLSYELVMFPMGVFGIDELKMVKTIQWITAVFWTADIFVVFNTGIIGEKGNLIMDRQQIVIRYFRTWLVPDVTVVALDWIMLFNVGAGESSPVLKFGKMLRYLRMARLLRLLRLRKLKEVMRRLDDYVNSVYFTALKSIVVNMLTIIVISHFLGCAWYAVGSTRIAGYESWVAAYDFDFAQVDWEYAYLTSLHWSITQFTPGSMSVQPQNIPERAFAVGMLVMGMILFSSIVSNITMATNNLKQITARYDRELTMLRRFLNQEKISSNLTRRVVRYSDMVVKPKLLKIASADVHLLKHLPLPLYQEVVMELYEQHLNTHPFFRNAQAEYPMFARKLCFCALGETCLASECDLFGPGESADCMYFLLKGAMTYKREHVPKAVKARDFFVEMVLWCPWIFQGRMLAESECELLRIESQPFRDAALQYSMCLKEFASYAERYVKALNAAKLSDEEFSDISKVVHSSEELATARGGPPPEH